MTDEGHRVTQTIEFDPDSNLDLIQNEEEINIGSSEPQNIETDPGYILILSQWVETLLYLPSLILFSMTVLMVRKRKFAQSFKNLFCLELAKLVIISLVILVRKSNRFFGSFRYKFNHLNRMLGTVLISFAIWMYFEEKLSPKFLVFFTIPYFFGYLFCLKLGKATDEDESDTLSFLSMGQILLLALNFGKWIEESYVQILLPYEVFYFGVNMVSLLITIMFSFSLLAYLFNFRNIRFTTVVSTFSLFLMSFFHIWYFITTYSFLLELMTNLDNGVFEAPGYGDDISRTMQQFFLLYQLLGLISIPFLTIGMFLNTRMKSFFDDSIPIKTFKLQKFSKVVNISLQKKSETYFSKSHLDETLISETCPMSSCYICSEQEGNVLIKPCDHFGVCEKCLMNWMISSEVCPLCKQEITKFYLLEWNEQEKRYQTKARVICSI